MIMITAVVRNTIKQKINQLIDIGENDKTEIYSRIVEDFGVERRDVRLIARELRQDWKKKVKVLQGKDEEIN